MVVAAALMGCGRGFVRSAEPMLAQPWRSRSGGARAAAVLVRVSNDLDKQASAPNMDWGLYFYRAGSGTLRAVAPLAASAHQELGDESDGVFLVPLPEGDYVATSLYTTIGGEAHIIAVPGASFERFTLGAGEVRVLGAVDSRVRLRPEAKPGVLTSWTQVAQTVSGRMEPGMPRAFAKSALTKIFSGPDTLSGWEPALKALAAQ